MTAAVAGASEATLPVVTALLDRASDSGRRRSGVLGIRARPTWDGKPAFEHAGLPVVVVPCVSALAVREALLDRPADGWLVVLTDRDEKDLGTGITAHMASERLRSPDPWLAVQTRFAATRLDPRLLAAAQGRDLAHGLLTVGVDRRWPPARGGLLTLEHAFAAVAAAELGVAGADDAVDASEVLRWTTVPGATARVADLRAAARDPLADAVLGWLAEACGRAAPVVRRLLAEGRLGDAVPLGLAARAVLPTPAGSGPWALLRRLVGAPVGPDAAAAYATAAEGVVRDLLRDDDPQAPALLARADALLAALEATDRADESDLLRAGLTARLEALGEALRRGGDVEAAWRRVEAHALSARLERMRATRALSGVRLSRWLAAEGSAPSASGPAGDLPAAVARYRDAECWVDRAYADAWAGAAEPSLADGLREVLAAVRQRREAHDREFAAALAAQQAGPAGLPADVVHIEDVLARVVLPLARTQPVLLVVADGMTLAVAGAIVENLRGRLDAWQECQPTALGHRLTALTALPSVTEVSRASLLTGTLTVGQQATERPGFEAWLRSVRLTGRLFHKLSLEATGAGRDVSPEVAAAVDDVTGLPLVACVLNTIDDALDRSDPGGTDWTADAVKHLVPLLDRARRGGRAVVLTSDHGHVVERREGRMSPVAGASSNRSRPFAGGPPVEDGEVRVRGPRVLAHDGDAVLAVDERLRYGPVKAGYHGGAAPAEVVVGVHVLVPGADAPAGWQVAPPPAPVWWRSPLSAVPAERAAAAPLVLPATPEETPGLFDEMPAAPDRGDLVAGLLSSPGYAEQRRRAARATLGDRQVGALLRALAVAPAYRLDEESAAAALGVATVHLGGALAMAQRLLNVEQYPVLERDLDAGTVVLDPLLLREQFGLG